MQDLHWAVRTLRKNVGFTALALLTLTLGIGATCTAFAVLDGVLLRPLPYRDADRLVFIRERTAARDLNPPSHPNFLDWRERGRVFDGVGSAMFPAPRTVTPAPTGGDPLRLTTMGVSRRFFEILGVRLANGREFTDDENTLGGAPVAMVSFEFWRDQMGSRLPLGSIRVGEGLRTVVGVLPAGFTFVTPADVYLPHEQGPGTCRTCRNYMVVGRLRDRMTIDAARGEMSALSAALFATYGNDTNAADVDLQPLRDYLVKDYRTLLGVVFGAAALVLLIACTNLLSAQLARGWAREREIVVRGALGASRRRLLQQLLVESGVLVAGGAALGIGFAVLLTHAIRSVGAGVLPRLAEVGVDLRIVIFVLVLVTATTVLVGVYPAWRLSGGDPGRALRGARGSTMTVRAAAWRLLVGLEIAIALMLAVGSTLLVRTLHNILNHDTGFGASGVVTASIVPSEADAPRLDDARRALAALPSVEGVAFTTRLPLSWGANSGPVRRPTDPLDRDWPAMAGFRIVSPDYFAVLHQPVLRGRPFTGADRQGAPLVAIVTPGIAEKLWPRQDPIGKIIATNYLMTQWLTVVGVAAEASSWTMPRGAQNEIFVPMAQQPAGLEQQGQIVAVARTAARTTSIIPLVRDALHRTMPTSPAQIRTMEDRIASTAADRRFAMIAITVFAFVALVLAGIGVYGVVWYTVTTRTHEIGVRMALGATAANVRTQLLRGAMMSAVGGVAVGEVVALFAGRFLETILFGVSRADAPTYVISSALVLAAVVAGAFVPARRASRLDPLIAIRTDV